MQKKSIKEPRTGRVPGAGFPVIKNIMKKRKADLLTA